MRPVSITHDRTCGVDSSPAHVCSHGAPPPASGNKPHKDGSGWAGPALPRPCAGQRAGVPQSAPALTNRSVSDPPYYPIPHRGTSGRPSTPSVPPLFPDGTAIFRRLKGAIPRGLNSGEGTTAWRGVKHLACRQQERALRSAEIKRIHWQRRRATVMMSHAVAVSRGPCASCLYCMLIQRGNTVVTVPDELQALRRSLRKQADFLPTLRRSANSEDTTTRPSGRAPRDISK